MCRQNNATSPEDGTHPNSWNLGLCYITQQKVFCSCDSVNDTKRGDDTGLFRWTQSNHVCVLSCVQVSVTPWTVAHQAPVSMAFSRQEYCSLLQGVFRIQGQTQVPCIASRFFTVCCFKKFVSALIKSFM